MISKWFEKIIRLYEHPLNLSVLQITNERQNAHRWHFYIYNSGEWEDILNQSYINEKEIEELKSKYDYITTNYATKNWSTSTFLPKGDYATKGECDKKIQDALTELDPAKKSDLKDWLEKTEELPTDALDGLVYLYIGSEEGYVYGGIYKAINRDYVVYIKSSDTTATRAKFVQGMAYLAANYFHEYSLNSVELAAAWEAFNSNEGCPIIVPNVEGSSDKIRLFSSEEEADIDANYVITYFANIGVNIESSIKYVTPSTLHNVIWEPVYDLNKVLTDIESTLERYVGDNFLPKDGGTIDGNITLQEELKFSKSSTYPLGVKVNQDPGDEVELHVGCEQTEIIFIPAEETITLKIQDTMLVLTEDKLQRLEQLLQE